MKALSRESRDFCNCCTDTMLSMHALNMEAYDNRWQVQIKSTSASFSCFTHTPRCGNSPPQQCYNICRKHNAAINPSLFQVAVPPDPPSPLPHHVSSVPLAVPLFAPLINNPPVYRFSKSSGCIYLAKLSTKNPIWFNVNISPWQKRAKFANILQLRVVTLRSLFQGAACQQRRTVNMFSRVHHGCSLHRKENEISCN